MDNIYELKIIPDILKNFKVENIIINGLSDSKLVEEILNYDASIIAIDSNNHNNLNLEVINEHPLKVLPNLNNYDAIFIDDDPNWYTVFNQMNIIKSTNNNFPLVFICNNKFPHKRRDSYSNPDNIPIEFRHEFSKELPITYNNQNILIKDKYYHAIDENNDKNGVLTAIEDFLLENSEIGVMNIQFIEEIVILYPKSTISRIRIDKIMNDIKDKTVADTDLYTVKAENKMLLSYIYENNFSLENIEEMEDLRAEISQQNDIIVDLENEIKIHDKEIEYKNSMIDGVKSQLNLKDSQIKNLETKVINKDIEIENLTTQRNNLTNNLNQIQIENAENEKLLQNKINEIKTENAQNERLLQNRVNEKLKVINGVFSNFENQIDEIMENNSEVVDRLEVEQNSVNNLKKQNTYLHSQIDSNKYCISCFKEEISNNKLEIQYLKKHKFSKMIFSPLTYLFILLKSKPRELPLNIKLYKALKNSKCFDIGFYLKNNEDLRNSNWCRYFSPELHYICYGFDENREFNKRYYNRNSKKELLEYLLTCEEN